MRHIAGVRQSVILTRKLYYAAFCHGAIMSFYSTMRLGIVQLGGVRLGCMRHFTTPPEIHANWKILVPNEIKTKQNFVKTESEVSRKFLLNTVKFCSSIGQNLPYLFPFLLIKLAWSGIAPSSRTLGSLFRTFHPILGANAIKLFTVVI